MIGIGLKLSSVSILSMAAVIGFSPLSLFASGEQGAWYDPSDFLPNWRLNLLTYSEQFDNAAWIKTGSTVIPNVATAPNGTLTADALFTTTATTIFVVGQNYTVGAASTSILYAKTNTTSFLQLSYNGDVTSYANFNLSTGVVGSSGGTVTHSMEGVGDGWYKCIVNNSSSAVAGITWGIVSSATATRRQTFTGTGAESIYIWGADLRLTSNASVSPTYQKITDGVQDYLTYQPVMFQDSAGTTPVTAVEQPVGLILDKSKGLALGSELTSGALSGVTGWTLDAYGSVTGGALVINTPVSTSSDQVYTPPVSGTFVSGRRYAVTISVLRTNGIILFKLGSGGDLFSITASGTFTAYLQCGGGTPNSFSLSVAASAVNNFVGSITSISVRELPGNHAFQSTSASRPVLSARYNLLTETENFAAAAWTKSGTTVDGFTITATGTTHRFDQTVSVVPGVAYTFAFYAQRGTITDAKYSVFDASNASNIIPSTSYYAELNSSSLKKVTISFTAPAGCVSARVYLLRDSGATGTIILGAAGFGPDLRASNDGVGLPSYQRVGAATDYDTTGFPYYLRFDGTDDSLATSAIDFTATDKMAVFAGVRKLSDAAFSVIVELSSNFNSNEAFVLGGPNGANTNYYYAQRHVTVPAYSDGRFADNAAPSSSVVTITADRALALNEVTEMRQNGVSKAITRDNNGNTVGNFGNYPLFIGSRNNASNRFNGRLYSLIVLGRTATAAEIANTEAYINARTRAY